MQGHERLSTKSRHRRNRDRPRRCAVNSAAHRRSGRRPARPPRPAHRWYLGGAVDHAVSTAMPNGGERAREIAGAIFAGEMRAAPPPAARAAIRRARSSTSPSAEATSAKPARARPRPCAGRPRRPAARRIRRAADGSRSRAPHWRLVIASAPQGPRPSSAMSARPATAAPATPRARARASVAAVRSPSGSGRVTSSRTDQAVAKKSAPARRLSSRPASAPSEAASPAIPRASSRTPRCRRASRSGRGTAGGRRRWSHGPRSACGRSRRARRGRRARQASAVLLSAWLMRIEQRRASSHRRRASRSRRCPARPPGGIRRAARMAVAASARPSRLRPASASKVASTSPSSSLRSRVSTLPRNGTTARSGRSRFTSACRRSEAVPTTAPCRSSRSVLALRLMKTSRGSSRGSDRHDREALRQHRRHVLGRMHREVDRRRRAAPPRSPW